MPKLLSDTGDHIFTKIIYMLECIQCIILQIAGMKIMK